VQRMWLVAATASIVCERGPAAVTVAAIVERSGTERRLLTQLLEDEEGCIAAAFDKALAVAAERTIPWFAAQNGPLPRVETAVERLVYFCAEEPELAAVLLAPDRRTAPRRARMILTLARVARSELERTTPQPPPPDTCAAAMGAALATAAQALPEGETCNWTELAQSVFELVLTPYLGAADARARAAQLTLRHDPRRPVEAPRRPSLELRLTAELLGELAALGEAGERTGTTRLR
jgi:AcrR family transcriptional regulator